MSQNLCRCGNINPVVYLLVIIFGIASWVDINGLWVELPILVQNLPEGWDLPSYMSIIIQIANIAPLVYTVASNLWPHRVLEVSVSFIIISLGAVACFLLAFLWDVTSEIAGTEHSTALFVLQFCLALVDCTSSVAFLPFMSVFKPEYMTAYFIGEGFSGLIPSLVALGQGAGSMKCVKVPQYSDSNNDTMSNHTNIINQTVYYNATTPTNITLSTLSDTLNFTTDEMKFSIFPVYQEPRFTVQTFFLILMSLLIMSGISFTLLNYWSYCKKEYVNRFRKPSELSATKPSPILQWSPVNDADTDDELGHIHKAGQLGVNGRVKKSNFRTSKGDQGRDVRHQNGTLIQHDLYDSASSKSDSSEELHKEMAKSKYALFLILTMWLNALTNAVLPSLQTYSCLPYGIQPYHLSVTLANIANPLACMVSLFLKMTSVTWTLAMSVLGSGLASYVILTAVTSPEPPLIHHFAGSIVLVFCWVLLLFILTYTKVCIAMEFRKEGKKALLWVGASQQAGSLAGAIVIFVLINVVKMFQVANPCI